MLLSYQNKNKGGRNMIDDWLNNYIFDPVKEFFAFLIYWAGWFIVIPVAIWFLYILIRKLYNNIEMRHWWLVALQVVLVIALVCVSWKLFFGFLNTGISIDPDRPTGIEKAVRDVGKD